MNNDIYSFLLSGDDLVSVACESLGYTDPEAVYDEEASLYKVVAESVQIASSPVVVERYRKARLRMWLHGADGKPTTTKYTDDFRAVVKRVWETSILQWSPPKPFNSSPQAPILDTELRPPLSDRLRYALKPAISDDVMRPGICTVCVEPSAVVATTGHVMIVLIGATGVKEQTLITPEGVRFEGRFPRWDAVVPDFAEYKSPTYTVSPDRLSNSLGVIKKAKAMFGGFTPHFRDLRFTDGGAIPRFVVVDTELVRKVSTILATLGVATAKLYSPPECHSPGGLAGKTITGIGVVGLFMALSDKADCHDDPRHFDAAELMKSCGSIKGRSLIG